MKKIKSFFSQYPQLYFVILLVFVWFVFFVLGQFYPTEPVSPVSPVAKIQQVEETGTPTPTPTPTLTPTPTHWTSYAVEVWCDDEAVSDSPVELDVTLGEDEIPLVSLNINLQLQNEVGEVLLQQASFNVIAPPLESCTGEYLEIPYDWRNFEDNLAIPTGTVYEYGMLSYSSFISNVTKAGTPWAENEQGWYYVENGTPEAKEYNEYTLIRSFEWASPTPTPEPTATATPTPTPRVIKIYLPIVMKRAK